MRSCIRRQDEGSLRARPTISIDLRACTLDPRESPLFIWTAKALLDVPAEARSVICRINPPHRVVASFATFPG